METGPGSEPRPTPDTPRPTPDEARQALDAVAESRAQIAERIRRGPRWYDAAYGAACGLLVLSFGVPQPWSIIGLLVAAVAFGALIGAYRAATGIALGVLPRPLPWGTFVVLGLVVVVAGVASWVDGHHGLYWGVVLVAVLTAAAAWALSRRYTADLIALLEGDAEGDVPDGAA